jgi:hypothetical protein
VAIWFEFLPALELKLTVYTNIGKKRERARGLGWVGSGWVVAGFLAHKQSALRQRTSPGKTSQKLWHSIPIQYNSPSFLFPLASLGHVKIPLTFGAMDFRIYRTIMSRMDGVLLQMETKHPALMTRFPLPRIIPRCCPVSKETQMKNCVRIRYQDLKGSQPVRKHNTPRNIFTLLHLDF